MTWVLSELIAQLQERRLRTCVSWTSQVRALFRLSYLSVYFTLYCVSTLSYFFISSPPMETSWIRYKGFPYLKINGSRNWLVHSHLNLMVERFYNWWSGLGWITFERNWAPTHLPFVSTPPQLVLRLSNLPSTLSLFPVKKIDSQKGTNV